MKSFYLLIAGFCLLHSGLTYGRVTVNGKGATRSYEFQVDRVTLSKEEVSGESFNHVVLEGLTGYDGIAFKAGAPQMPVVRFYVDGDVSVEASESGAKTTVVTTLPVVPSLLSAAKYAGEVKRLTIDKSAYDSPQSPKKFIEVQRIGTVHGVPRSLVTVYPVAYDPRSGAIHVKTQFTVKVSGVEVTSQPSILLAPQIAIVAGAQFIGNTDLQAFVSLKQRAGYRTTVINAGELGNDADRIRERLREVYSASQRSLKYVVIVGDNEDVAAKTSEHIDGSTDHYYACLDTADYESDIGAPDVGVGRISVSNATELKDVVAKLIKYETANFTSRAWLKEYSFLASDDGNYWQVAEGTHNYAIDTYTAPKGFLGTFPVDPTTGGDKLYAVTHHADGPTSVRHIREGRGLVNYGGHGAVTFWAAPYMNRADVLALNDPNHLPVVIANACITGRFIEDSFGETWLRHKFGAIMYWGSMDSTYWDEDDILERRMYDAIFSEGKLAFADFTDYALAEVWRYYGGAVRSKYYMETYVLFGDPSMRMHLN